MTQPRLKWFTQPAPTGLYRSFQTRGWPEARYGDSVVAYARSEAPYHVSASESTALEVMVADRSAGVGPFKWRKLKARPVGVAAAKALVAKFFAAHPEWLPTDGVHARIVEDSE